MADYPLPIPVEEIRTQLQRLRQGPALGHPGAVQALRDPLRALLLSRQPPLSHTTSDTTRLVAALRRAIDGLSPHERRHAAVDFHLLPEHSWPTLTERQESLARVLGRSAKTVRRHAGHALDTLALLLSDGSYLTPPNPPATAAATSPAAPAGPSSTATPRDTATPIDSTIARFFGITPGCNVHIVGSTVIPGADHRLRPSDPLYARYAGFADLDALIYLRTRLAHAFPTATIRDFYPGEYYNADPHILIVLGTPHRNPVYADFLPHLPYRFAPPPDAAITFPNHPTAALAPTWTPEGELITDVALITRLTLTQGTTVILLGGCLTLGVLGAAKCLLSDQLGEPNTARLHTLGPDTDLIAATTIRRLGGITDTPDLNRTPPSVFLTRNADGGFAPLGGRVEQVGER